MFLEKNIKNYIKLFSLLLVMIFSINSKLKADIKVVTTIQPLYSIISNVMGNNGNLSLILEGTASPHSFTFKPSKHSLEKWGIIGVIAIKNFW